MKMRELQRSLKKRAALLLTSCMLLTGCGAAQEPASIVGPQTGQTATEKILAYTHTYTDAEIEKRIEQIGAKYDGLYMPELDLAGNYRSYSKSSATNGAVMYEAAAESYDSEDGGYYCEPVPGTYEPADWNTEEYNPVKESGFLSVFTSPFSTFGADVDTACFTEPNTLSLVKFNATGSTSILQDYQEGTAYYGGSYSTTKHTAQFRISEYLQELLLGKEENYGLSLGINGGAYLANRLVINGPETESDNLRVEVTYSLVSE